MTKTMQTYQGTIYPWHCDHLGHMNVMYYVGKFDEATWHFFSQIGISNKVMRDEGRGLVAIEQTLKYKRELLAGDIIIIRSKIVEFSDKSLTFAHEMFDAETDELCATAIFTGLYFDKGKRKAISFPETIKETMQGFLED